MPWGRPLVCAGPPDPLFAAKSIFRKPSRPARGPPRTSASAPRGMTVFSSGLRPYLAPPPRIIAIQNLQLFQIRDRDGLRRIVQVHHLRVRVGEGWPLRQPVRVRVSGFREIRPVGNDLVG